MTVWFSPILIENLLRAIKWRDTPKFSGIYDVFNQAKITNQ